jgi:hypothetical protein
MLRIIRFPIFYSALVILVGIDGTTESAFGTVSRVSMGYSTVEMTTSNYMIIVNCAIAVWVIYEMTVKTDQWMLMHNYIFARCSQAKRERRFLFGLLGCVARLTVCKFIIDVVYISLDSNLGTESFLNVIILECAFGVYFVGIGIILYFIVYAQLRLRTAFLVIIVLALIVQFVSIKSDSILSIFSVVPKDILVDFPIVMGERLVAVLIIFGFAVLLLIPVRKRLSFQM